MASKKWLANTLQGLNCADFAESTLPVDTLTGNSFTKTQDVGKIYEVIKWEFDESDFTHKIWTTG